MFLKTKKNIFIVIFLLLILIFVGFFLFVPKKPNNIQELSLIPTQELIPTVDTSVKVDFSLLKKGEVLLTVSFAPKGTKEIDFELSYQSINSNVEDGMGEKVEQGVIGKCYQIESQWQCGEEDDGNGRKIVLGTCSSGVCRYHNIAGPIKVVLRFSGSFGEKIFEKDFNIN